MDDEFLRYYENELDDLRRASKRFAAEYPKVARRLQLGEGESLGWLIKTVWGVGYKFEVK